MTVAPSGDVSWRGYSGDLVGTMKVGNVGDWDLSGLEDESLVIGGTDGSVSRCFGRSSCPMGGV